MCILVFLCEASFDPDSMFVFYSEHGDTDSCTVASYCQLVDQRQGRPAWQGMSFYAYVVQGGYSAFVEAQPWACAYGVDDGRT